MKGERAKVTVTSKTSSMLSMHCNWEVLVDKTVKIMAERSLRGIVEQIDGPEERTRTNLRGSV